MMTENPFKLIGVYDWGDYIKLSKDMDLVFLDEACNVTSIFAKGKEFYYSTV